MPHINMRKGIVRMITSYMTLAISAKLSSCPAFGGAGAIAIIRTILVGVFVSCTDAKTYCQSTAVRRPCTVMCSLGRRGCQITIFLDCRQRYNIFSASRAIAVAIVVQHPERLQCAPRASRDDEPDEQINRPVIKPTRSDSVHDIRLVHPLLASARIRFEDA